MNWKEIEREERKQRDRRVEEELTFLTRAIAEVAGGCLHDRPQGSTSYCYVCEQPYREKPKCECCGRTLP